MSEPNLPSAEGTAKAIVSLAGAMQELVAELVHAGAIDPDRLIKRFETIINDEEMKDQLAAPIFEFIIGPLRSAKK